MSFYCFDHDLSGSADNCPVCNLRKTVQLLKTQEAIIRQHVAKLELDLLICQSAHQDDLKALEGQKDIVREIYALRGEDPEIHRLCNKILS